MRVPMPAPTLAEMFQKLLNGAKPERFAAIMGAGVGPTDDGKYRHWDTLRYRKPPADLTPEEWWTAVKLARRPMYKQLPLLDRSGKPFVFAVPDILQELLYKVDRDAAGAIQGAEPVTDPSTRDTYLFRSLVEEAITSSQIEGASTTRKVAKEMIQTGRPPRDKSERMILNNYEAMRFIRDVKDIPLTPAIVLELQRRLTEGTLAEPDAAGRLRRSDEPIVIEDESGRLLHIPPNAEELEVRLDVLCKFANGSSETGFIHPAIRATLLHLGLAYDHPFVDGNGRTARALFYWAMAKQGYWLCEYLAVSRVIRRAPIKYYHAFLYAETDDNDATYFVLNQLRATLTAIDELHKFLGRKLQEQKETRALLKTSQALKDSLNHRQLGLLHHAIRNAPYTYTIDSHQRSNGVAYDTARTDLLELAERKILEKRRDGRRFVFRASEDLKGRLEKLK